MTRMPITRNFRSTSAVADTDIPDGLDSCRVVGTRGFAHGRLLDTDRSGQHLCATIVSTTTLSAARPSIPMSDNLESLEAVFYSSPIPYDLATLTFLGLVFDRVYFPNVYIPTEGFDPEEVQQEIERIQGTGLQDTGTRLLMALMSYTLIPEVQEFCCFTGTQGQIFGGENIKEAKDLVIALQNQIHGPPKPNFIPTHIPGHHKSLNEDQYIDYPGDYYYQCNALLYAAKHNIPLLNAEPRLPVPAIGGEGIQNNAKLLSAIMAIECVNLVMPEIGELEPSQILEARDDLSKHVRPFRISMLRLSAELNRAIGGASTKEDIIAAGKFIVETDVLPTLLELKSELEKPRKGWLSRTWNLTKKVPRLACSYATMNLEAAIPQTVEALGDWLVAGASRGAPRSDYFYLLKLEELGKK